MEYILIIEDLFVSQKIVDPFSPEGQKIHQFLEGRARRLAGNKIDFDKNPITFALCDSASPNAFFTAAQDEEETPKRHEYYNKLYVTNPLNTPVIAVTKGLIDLVDNQDQLDHVLAHELTHRIISKTHKGRSSKGEELLSNLHAIDLVYDAGSDPKQALVLDDKLLAYRQRLEEQKKGQDSDHDDEKKKTEGIDWSEIINPHVSQKNNRTALEASLTRLSHLIDDRTPSSFDKSIFDVAYSDPVTEFLTAKDYKNQTVAGKLKILIDSIEHLAKPTDPDEYYQKELKRLAEEEARLEPDAYGPRYDIKDKRKNIELSRKKGHEDFYRGATIEKKYQQAIAKLAERAFHDAYYNSPNGPAIADADIVSLDVYLKDKAYNHISKDGYPDPRHINYLESSCLLYTYFYLLIGDNHPRNRGISNLEQFPDYVPPRLETDKANAKQAVRTAKNASDLFRASDEFQKLQNLHRNLGSAEQEERGRLSKLDNLSFLYTRNGEYLGSSSPFSKPEEGKPVSWNHLLRFAQQDENTKNKIIELLKSYDIEDYRLIQGLPYICWDKHCYYKVDSRGSVTEKIDDYDLDYAVRKPLVLETFAKIKAYFDQETALFETACTDLLQLSDDDFVGTSPHSKDVKAHDKIYSFLHLYNTLPLQEDKQKGRRQDDRVFAYISEQYLEEKHLKTDGKRLSYALFRFDNPVFQEHFGKDFEDQINNRKSKLQEKMFATALKAIEQAAITWAAASAEREELYNKISEKREQQYALDKKDPAREAIEKELKELSALHDLAHNKKELATNLVFNFSCGFLEKEEHKYSLNRLTPEQQATLADYIIRDETGVLSKILDGSRYVQFCDFRRVLGQQIHLVTAGNYDFTEQMTHVAKTYGYSRADTAEALSAYAMDPNRHEWSSSKYEWGLHLFDAMRFLENRSDYSIAALAKTINCIKETKPERYSSSKPFAQSNYQDYLTLIKDTRLLSMIGKVVDNPKNYENLSVKALIETADRLIKLTNQLVEVLDNREEDTYDDDYDNKRLDKFPDIMKPENQALLKSLYSGISKALREAQNQALKKDNPLEKMRDLYTLYNIKENSYSGRLLRSSSLKTLIEQEGSLKAIAKLSKKPDFWPKDPLAHVQAFVFAKKTFLDDVVLENKLMNDLLDKIEALPPGEKSDTCLRLLLDKNLRAPYPETRERLFELYSDRVSAKLGPDDWSESYKRKLVFFLKSLDEFERPEWDIGERQAGDALLDGTLSAADKYQLLRKVSDRIVSQEETSRLLQEACQINISSEDLAKSYLYGVGADYLTAEMDRSPESAKVYLEFLNSKGESKDCTTLSTYIRKVINKRYNASSEEYRIHNATTPKNCKVLYENFWSAPLEARAVFISRILKSATSEKGQEQPSAQTPWERVFDLVMNTMIREEDTSIESRYARDVMHSYIKARSDYERVIILSAMMVANRNIGADAGNVGKALKLFLENMGPAEIKLGQAIASHPNTPEMIAKELQELKNKADMPPRWELYELIRTMNVPEELWKNVHLGEILGSASYYVTVALGAENVLRLLHLEAREKAAKGFRVIGETVADLREKDSTSDLDYKELTSSVAEMVTQAARMADIETNLEIGQKQYELAQKIYNGVQINHGQETFTLKVMDWKARGDDWVIMRRAKGPVFNELPETTPEEIAYKKSLAKGYIVFEVRNILSGEMFDHDKHGAQLCADKATNDVGIFDTGAMALRNPTAEEQRQLGHVLYDAMKALYQSPKDKTNEHQLSVFASALSGKIEELHNAQQDPQYLVEVKKGLLALGDFFKVLDKDDIRDLVAEIDILSHISEPTRAGMMEKMSFAEKALFKLHTASSPLAANQTTVRIQQAHVEVTRTTKSYETTPDKPTKSDWFDTLLAQPAEGDDSKAKPGNRQRYLSDLLPSSQEVLSSLGGSDHYGVAFTGTLPTASAASLRAEAPGL